jgi:tetratricopeptide (TPR) repeat protein
LALWLLGYPDRALVRAEEALRQPSLAPTDRACALHAVAEVCAWRGELARSYDAAREELEICQAFGIRAGVFGCAENAFTTLGWVLLKRGEFAEALKQLSSAIEEIRGRGRKLMVPLYLGRLALSYLATDDEASSSAVIAQAISLANETGERAWDAELLRVNGEIAVKRGANDEATHAFRSAIEIAQAQQAKAWELRATTSLARLLADQGRRQEAHALLAPIYGWFTEGFDTTDLREAKALLATLSS